jgi:hypothetical protein
MVTIMGGAKLEESVNVHVPVGADVRNVGVLGVEEDVSLDAAVESKYLDIQIII